MDPYIYLVVVAVLLLAFGAFVAFMAHRQRLEDEAAEVPDVAAE